MDLHDDGYIRDGLIGVLVTLVLGLAGLFGWRQHNGVKTANATADRESRFQDNLQQRYDRAMGRISELTDELDLVKARLAEADKRLTVVQMVAVGDPTLAIEISRDSAFIDLSRPMRPRPKVTPTTSPMDPFQAADPYAPPKRRK